MHNIQASFAACAIAALLTWGAQTASSAPPPDLPNAKPADPATGASPRAGHAAAVASASSPVIASFKGGRITVADMEAAIANKDPGTRARIAAPGGRQAFLEQLIRYDLLVLEAERRGYGDHFAVIDAGKRAAIGAMAERDLAVDPSSISRSDVESHFRANLDKYHRAPMRRASHIELANEAEARALIAELKGASRERFAKLAGERSNDERTRRQGGELGYFDREGRRDRDSGQPIAAELAQAAFALKRSGDISRRPIARPDGRFSVVMLTGEMPGSEPGLSVLEPLIREELATQRAKEAESALVAELEKQWKPEVHPERMAAIQLEAGSPLDQPQGFPAAPPDPRAPARIVEPDDY